MPKRQRRSIQQRNPPAAGCGIHWKTQAEMNKKSRKQKKRQNGESVHPPVESAQFLAYS